MLVAYLKIHKVLKLSSLRGSECLGAIFSIEVPNGFIFVLFFIENVNDLNHRVSNIINDISGRWQFREGDNEYLVECYISRVLVLLPVTSFQGRVAGCG